MQHVFVLLNFGAKNSDFHVFLFILFPQFGNPTEVICICSFLLPYVREQSEQFSKMVLSPCHTDAKSAVCGCRWWSSHTRVCHLSAEFSVIYKCSAQVTCHQVLWWMCSAHKQLLVLPIPYISADCLLSLVHSPLQHSLHQSHLYIVSEGTENKLGFKFIPVQIQAHHSTVSAIPLVVNHVVSNKWLRAWETKGILKHQWNCPTKWLWLNNQSIFSLLILFMTCENEQTDVIQNFLKPNYRSPKSDTNNKSKIYQTYTLWNCSVEVICGQFKDI